MKISALYARVSTKGQENEKTIDSQIAEIEARAKEDGNTIGTHLHFEDNGWSGELLARPALDSLRDAVKNKAFEILYVYDLGRLSRNFLNQLILKKEFTEAGIKIVSLHDINGNSQESILAQNVMGLFHDYERIKIAERFRRGKLYKAKNGILFGWEAPYGYRYIKSNGDNKGHFEIEQHEAGIIKKIYELIANEHMTIRQVIKRLFDLNICPRKSKNNYWSTSTLSKRLRDETYIGTTYFNKTLSVSPLKPYNTEKYRKVKKSSRKTKPKSEWFAISVPSIIEKELFDRVQEQLIRNDVFAMRNKKNNYLLSNLIFCTCGFTRAGEGVSKTVNNLYYRCTDRVRSYPLPKKCHNKGVNATVLDNLVWEKISTLLSQPQLAKKYYEQWKDQKFSNNKPTNEINDIKNTIESLKSQETRFLKAYGEGAISLDQYKDQINDLKLKIIQYTSKLDRLNKESTNQLFSVPDFETVYDKMDKTLDDFSFEKRRLIIKNILNRVVTDGVSATVTGYLPLEINSEQINQNVEFKTEYRNCRLTKRGQKHSF